VPLIVIEQENSGPAAARNAAISAAAGGLIVFIDDDVVPTPAMISAHVEAHDPNGPPAVVIGPMLDPVDHQLSPWVRWEQRMLAKQYRALEGKAYEPTFRQFYTGNASIPKDALDQVGGFDPAYRRAEDIELGLRLGDQGARFVYEPRAIGYHYAIRSFTGWRDIAHIYGRVEVDFADRGKSLNDVDFLLHNYRSRSRAVRLLVWGALGFPRVTDAVAARSASVVQRLDRGRGRWAGQLILSAVYATDYWSGVAAALGGRRELYRALRERSNRGRRPFVESRAG
jgi:GT2 family glycosyltransferase